VLEVPSKDLLSRLSARGRSSERSDDSPEVIGKRLAVYEQQTKPVVEHYQKTGLLKRIDGVGDVDQIRQRVEQAIV
jgi:adenylate kinase